jgi:DNA-binding transcriptional MerR regulator
MASVTPASPRRRRTRADGNVRLTVDELARGARTTTRQVRALQTRGLLPHPRLEGRTGYYDQVHLDRLRAILRLQGSGFSLAAIASLFDAHDAGMTLPQVLGLSQPASVDVEADPLDGWPAQAGGRLLSVVPTTVLGDEEAS